MVYQSSNFSQYIQSSQVLYRQEIISSESKSEVTEAPEIPDKTFPEDPNFKFFKDLGIGKFKVSEVAEITENEIAVSDVHHPLKMTNSG